MLLGLGMEGFEVVQESGGVHRADRVERLVAQDGRASEVAGGEGAGGQPGEVERTLPDPTRGPVGDCLVEPGNGLLAVLDDPLTDDEIAEIRSMLHPTPAERT